MEAHSVISEVTRELEAARVALATQQRVWETMRAMVKPDWDTEQAARLADLLGQSDPTFYEVASYLRMPTTGCAPQVESVGDAHFVTLVK